MKILPKGTIYICSIPKSINTDYSNTILFKDKGSQATYYQSHSIKACLNYSPVKDTENTVRVEGRYSDYINANYMMFQNEFFTDKWFYAFITKVEYLNPNTSILHFEVDVMQTFFLFDCSLNYCIVEREHVSDDSPYNLNNSLDEGLGYGPYLLGEENNFNLQIGKPFILVELTEELSSEITSNPIWVQAVSNGFIKELPPGLYNGLYKPTYNYGFEYIEDSLETIKALVDYLARTGKLDAINAIYYTYEEFMKPGRYMSPVVKEVNFSSKRIGTYVPRNKKLLGYPYQYITLSGRGQEQNLKVELFEDPTKVKLKLSCPLEPGSSMFCYPSGYKNYGLNFSSGVSSQPLPLLSYTKDSYFNSYMTTINSREQSITASLTNQTLDLMTGAISGASKVAENPSISGAVSSGYSMTRKVLAIKQTFDKFKAEFQDTLNRPDSIGNQNSCPTTAFLYSFPTPYYQFSYITEEFAKKLDSYFDRFGYKVMNFEIPNIKSRKSYNYIKTIETDIVTSINQNECEKIKSILENGITFWHTTDVGNYGLDNNII